MVRGRLIRSSSLAELRAEAGVGSRVRTPDPDRLCAVLDAVGHAYRRENGDVAVEAAPEEVGELAARHGVVLYGLAGTADLEQAFFRLIGEPGRAETPATTEGVLS
jgi:ABC-2 type transport system ATP-binding protein